MKILGNTSDQNRIIYNISRTNISQKQSVDGAIGMQEHTSSRAVTCRRHDHAITLLAYKTPEQFRRDHGPRKGPMLCFVAPLKTLLKDHYAG